MKPHVRVQLQPLSHGDGLMHRELIQNQVDLLAVSADYSFVQKLHEIFAGMTCQATTLHFVSLNL